MKKLAITLIIALFSTILAWHFPVSDTWPSSTNPHPAFA